MNGISNFWDANRKFSQSAQNNIFHLRAQIVQSRNKMPLRIRQLISLNYIFENAKHIHAYSFAVSYSVSVYEHAMHLLSIMLLKMQSTKWIFFLSFCNFLFFSVGKTVEFAVGTNRVGSLLMHSLKSTWFQYAGYIKQHTVDLKASRYIVNHIKSRLCWIVTMSRKFSQNIWSKRGKED